MRNAAIADSIAERAPAGSGGYVRELGEHAAHKTVAFAASSPPHAAHFAPGATVMRGELAPGTDAPSTIDRTPRNAVQV